MFEWRFSCPFSVLLGRGQSEIDRVVSSRWLRAGAEADPRRVFVRAHGGCRRNRIVRPSAQFSSEWSKWRNSFMKALGLINSGTGVNTHSFKIAQATVMSSNSRMCTNGCRRGVSLSLVLAGNSYHTVATRYSELPLTVQWSSKPSVRSRWASALNELVRHPSSPSVLHN